MKASRPAHPSPDTAGGVGSVTVSRVPRPTSLSTSHRPAHRLDVRADQEQAQPEVVSAASVVVCGVGAVERLEQPGQVLGGDCRGRCRRLTAPVPNAASRRRGPRRRAGCARRHCSAATTRRCAAGRRRPRSTGRAGTSGGRPRPTTPPARRPRRSSGRAGRSRPPGAAAGRSAPARRGRAPAASRPAAAGTARRLGSGRGSPGASSAVRGRRGGDLQRRQQPPPPACAARAPRRPRTAYGGRSSPPDGRASR